MGDGEASAPLNYWRTRLSLVYAEEAVELLRRDERTRTIKERLDGYRDTSVSTLMLIGAQNQVELNITGGTFWLDLTKIIIGVVITLFCLPFVGFPVYPLLQAEQQTCHLRSFGVQLSPDHLTWRPVLCKGESTKFCVFKISVPDKTELVDVLRFPQAEEARYLQLLPQDWEGRCAHDGFDLRLGVMGDLSTPILDFRLEEPGISAAGQAWLQPGCKRNLTMGKWASQDARMGVAQCCLQARGVHVCTRDACLAGSDNMDWYQAQARCATRGWRLCSREELNRVGSSGCCGTSDLCGFDDRLVWTNTVVSDGSRLSADRKGKLHSDEPMENVSSPIVDLTAVKNISGIKLQGGISDVQFNGRACALYIWGIPILVGGIGCFIVAMTVVKPLQAVQLQWGQWLFEISLGITWLSVIFTDSAIPGAFSRNMLCKVVGPPIHSVTLALIILIVENCWKAIVYFFRPGLVFQLASPVAQLATSAILYLLLQNAGSFAEFLWIPFLLLPVFELPLELWWMKMAIKQARRSLEEDIESYQAVWSAAKSSPQASVALSRIKEHCRAGQSKLCAKRDNAISKLPW